MLTAAMRSLLPADMLLSADMLLTAELPARPVRAPAGF